MTTQSNIKNLPEGEYFTECGYSDLHAWKVISGTAKTVKLARVEVAADPEWKAKMEFHAGGFCGHMSNQGEQTWLFDRVNESCTITVRKTKNGWTSMGKRFLENRATEFYDYNF